MKRTGKVWEFRKRTRQQTLIKAHRRCIKHFIPLIGPFRYPCRTTVFEMKVLMGQVSAMSLGNLQLYKGQPYIRRKHDMDMVTTDSGSSTEN